MAITRRKPTRGLVLLYAISVFTIIASIGLAILDSGEAYVGNVNTDMHALVAQSAALSGLAYGEATIQEMLNMASVGRFQGAQGNVPPPAWAGRTPTAGIPYNYVPLLGAKNPLSTTENPTAFPIGPNTDAWTYTWTVDTRGGVEVERACFRIELRECAIPFPPQSPTPGVNGPYPTLGCVNNLYDENLIRIDFLWPGSSPFKPPSNQMQAFGLQHAPDTFIMFTMRVEGEAQTADAASATGFTPTARVVVKEPFTLRADVPKRIFPQVFWYQDLQQGY